MDELMLMEYLKNKGMGRNMSEHEFMDKFKEFMSDKFRRNSYGGSSGGGSRGSGSGGGSSMRRHNEEGFYPMDWDMFNNFLMRRHSEFPERFDEMFNSDEGRRFFDRFNRMSGGMREEDMFEMMKMMGKGSEGEHFNEPYAKYLVSEMYHIENGRKHVGEKFDMSKAKEICERYRGIIPHSVTPADVYVAINAQYHDYCELFKSWFGEGIDQKIIESAIIFWFKDDDYKDGFKLWNYFKEY